MTDSHPGVEDEVERALRLGLATGAQVADRVARARQELARHAQHRSEVEARQLESRYRAESAAATARLSLVDRTEWWERATTRDIIGMYELAAAWQHHEPHAAIAVETITWQVRERFDIDVTTPGGDSTELRAALAQLELDRAAATRDKGRASDTAAAVAAVLLAEQRDGGLNASHDMQLETVGTREPMLDEHAATSPAAGVDADATRERIVRAPYDSEQRRAGAAAELRDSGLSVETLAVAMRADVAHARPATEAATPRTHSSTSPYPEARSTSRSVQRNPRER